VYLQPFLRSPQHPLTWKQLARRWRQLAGKWLLHALWVQPMVAGQKQNMLPEQALALTDSRVT
jgi:hypothetical protein